MAQPRSLDARYFPNVSPRAYYSPHDLAVHMKTDVFNRASAGDDAYRLAWTEERLPILVHEYQHSVDHMSTVVGRELLDALMRALDGLAGKLEGNVAGLPSMLDYHDRQRRFYRREYFTEVRKGYQPGGDRPRWSWETSIGAGFDMAGRSDERDPIIFVRFKDEDQAVMVSRQPLTGAALFETRAVFAELDHDARQVAVKGAESPEWQRFNRRQQEMFYDHELTLYSAPAHMVASRSGASDPIDAYRLAARAAGVALNFTRGLELDPGLPARFARGGAGAPDAVARITRLMERLDPGFLFAAIVVAAPRFDGDDDAWLAAGLSGAGLPTEKAVMDGAERRLALPTLPDMPRLVDVYLQCVAAGAGNFSRLRPSGGVLDFQRMSAIGTSAGPLAIPSVFLADGVVQRSVIPVIDDRAQELMVNASAKLHEQLEELLAACR
jgi:hypothetical protein